MLEPLHRGNLPAGTRSSQATPRFGIDMEGGRGLRRCGAVQEHALCREIISHNQTLDCAWEARGHRVRSSLRKKCTGQDGGDYGLSWSFDPLHCQGKELRIPSLFAGPVGCPNPGDYRIP